MPTGLLAAQCDCVVPMSGTATWWWLALPLVALVGSVVGVLVRAHRSQPELGSTPSDPAASAAAEPDRSR